MFQVKPVVLAETPELSVTRTITLVNTCVVAGAVPVMTPLLLMLNPAGALDSVNVHGGLAQVNATVRLTAAPTVVVCVLGVVIVGATGTVQVKVPLVAVTFELSVTLTVTVA
jgi:hypothetical protein